MIQVYSVFLQTQVHRLDIQPRGSNLSNYWHLLYKINSTSNHQKNNWKKNNYIRLTLKKKKKKHILPFKYKDTISWITRQKPPADVSWVKFLSDRKIWWFSWLFTSGRLTVATTSNGKSSPFMLPPGIQKTFSSIMWVTRNSLHFSPCLGCHCDLRYWIKTKTIQSKGDNRES